MRNHRNNQNVNNRNDSFAFFNDYEIYDFTDDKLNITIHDKNKNNFFSVRKFPNYSEKEFIDIKKMFLITY